MMVSTMAVVALLGARDPLWGMCGEYLAVGNPLYDTLYLGTGGGPYGFWWGASYPYADSCGKTDFWYKASTDSLMKWNDSLRTLGYSFVYLRIGDGTPSCWSAMPFGWNELHPDDPNKYDTLAQWAMQRVMDVHFWPPADPSNWANDVDSVISHAYELYSTGQRGPIDYFRFLNEPDAYRRHMLKAYYKVFVDTSQRFLDTLEYKYNSDSFRIIVQRQADYSTIRAPLVFHFYRWQNGNWVSDSTFYDTLVVSSSFEAWVKDTAWTPEYCVKYLEKPADSILKHYFPNAKTVSIPRSFDIGSCNEKPPGYPGNEWPSVSLWPYPYVINNPDTPGLYQWYDAYFTACEENGYWPDVVDYHFYTSWQIRSHPENPNEPFFTNPWKTLPDVLQAVIDVQQAHNIADIPIFISEIGVNSNTLASGPDWDIPWKARCDTQAVHLVAFYDVLLRKYDPSLKILDPKPLLGK